MSIIQYPDAINPSELQVWINEAFDNGESEDSAGIKPSWWNQSLVSSCIKENQSPFLEKSPVSFKSSVSSLPIKPLNSNSAIVNAQGHASNLVSESGMVSKNVIREEEKIRDEKKIDKEIEEIENEISRLSSRLEALRLEKAEKSLKKNIEKRGRIVPAKFMEPKQTAKIEEPSVSGAKTKINRRGVSLGPSEIFSANKSRLLNKPEITPLSTQNRRKSCFWKLEEIDELKTNKERGKSLSPRSRKTVSKIQAPKMAATTVGSKRSTKKEDGLLALIQPKTLFKDGEKSVANKKQLKIGRIVASRYNQISTNQSNGNLAEARKRALPDNDKEDANKWRASRENGLNQRIESSRVKKKWEIPSEMAAYKSEELVEEFASSAMSDMLPKIKTFRCVNETPRDSGAAKRVADLVGRKSFFSIDEEETAGDSVFQALSFEEDDVSEV